MSRLTRTDCAGLRRRSCRCWEKSEAGRETVAPPVALAGIGGGGGSDHRQAGDQPFQSSLDLFRAGAVPGLDEASIVVDKGVGDEGDVDRAVFHSREHIQIRRQYLGVELLSRFVYGPG